MGIHKDIWRAAVIKSLVRLMSWLPLWLCHSLGTVLGRLWYLLPTTNRAIIHRNLALCFPQLSPREQQCLARDTLIETARTMTELGDIWLWPPERVLRLIRQVSGKEQLDAALAGNKGVIIAAPHLGCWEMVGLYCAMQAPMTSLYRPPRMAGLDSMMRTAREHTGATLVPTNAQGVRALYQTLQRGEMVGILPDQDPGAGHGVFAPFFGISTNTMTLLSRLAHKSGAPVLLVFAERLPAGRGFHLHIQRIEPTIAGTDMVRSLTTLNQAIEQAVRGIPAQYQWSYKRFKTPSDGERAPY